MYLYVCVLKGHKHINTYIYYKKKISIKNISLKKDSCNSKKIKKINQRVYIYYAVLKECSFKTLLFDR
jgi:hypothetical protein